jgi:DNA-binding transcriptional ArsR family regulator
LPELDPVIHAQARLRVSVALEGLPTADQITFPRLQHLLRVSAVNLSTHLRKLEDAGYVELTKTDQRRTRSPMSGSQGRAGARMRTTLRLCAYS